MDAAFPHLKTSRLPRAVAAYRGAAEALLRGSIRALPSEQNRVFALTVIIGGVCGFAAVLFHLGIRTAEALMIDRAAALPSYWWVPAILATIVAGALACGIVLQFFFPAARGSGIPQVKVVYAIKSGHLRLRDSVAKFFIGIVQIGTGSSLGREGPTVHICAGIASGLGRLFALSPQNVRRLVPVGAAAGIAAAFNAPLAAVTFTIEEIVGDLDQTVLSGVVVAAALAAVIERTVLGEQPVFAIARDYDLSHPSSLLVYAALGVAAAAASHVFVRGMLALRLRFRRMTVVPIWAQPALGALVTGVVACTVIGTLHVGGVTGGGYAMLNRALNGGVAVHVMLALAAAKLVATMFSYSSGGAGGIFAPALFVGGMLGGAFSFFDSQLLGHADTQAGAFALVGMGAVFAGVIRAPITSFLIIFEMTDGYGLILPLMIANTTSYVLARKWHPRPVYDALIEQDGVRLPHRSTAAIALASLRVEEAMTKRPLVTILASADLRAALDGVAHHGFSAYPVVDDRGELVGLVSEAKLRRALAEGGPAGRVKDQLRSRETLRADQPLIDAIARMNKLGVRQMAVVDSLDPKALVGMFAMSDVVRAHGAVHEASLGPSD